MRVRNRTKHATLRWLSVRQVADALGISRWTAQRRIAGGYIPGAERMYAHDRGERWHVNREVFNEWLHQMHQAGLPKAAVV